MKYVLLVATILLFFLSDSILACSIAVLTDFTPSDGMSEIPRNVVFGPSIGECPELITASTGEDILLESHQANTKLPFSYCVPVSSPVQGVRYYFMHESRSISFNVNGEDDVDEPQMGIVSARREPAKMRNPIVNNSCDDLPPPVNLTVLSLADRSIPEEYIRLLVCAGEECHGPFFTTISIEGAKVLKLSYQIPSNVDKITVYPVDLSLNIGQPQEIHIENEIGCSCNTTTSKGIYAILLFLWIARKRHGITTRLT